MEEVPAPPAHVITSPGPLNPSSQAELLQRIGLVSSRVRLVAYDAWSQYEADTLLLPSPVRKS